MPREQEFSADNVMNNTMAQLDVDFAQTIRDLHDGLSSSSGSPVYTGFLASSWKVRRNPINQTDAREDFEPWASIKKSHDLPVWKRVFWMQFLAITAWAHLGFAQQKYPSHLLLPYYQGFSITIFTFGILGTVIGFFLTDLLPPELLRVVIFVTPIYILLLIMNARQKANRLAVVFGGALSPMFFPFVGEWAILLAGLIGGTLASLYGRFIAKWHLEPAA